MSVSTKVYRLLVRLDADPATEEADSVNNFYFHDDDVTPNLANMLDMVEDFYATALVSAAIPLYQAVGSIVLVGTGTILAYRLDDPTPRIPVAERAISWTRGTTALPTDVAMCMSFQGVKAAGEVQAQRRGRVYLGPFASNANTIVDATGRPAQTLPNLIMEAGARMLAASDASGSNTWGVESPTRRANAALPPSFTPISDGWVDNAWDTQRSRGRFATVRNPFDATGAL